MSAEVKGWIRVGAVLATYATIGAGIAAIGWVGISLTIALAHTFA